MSLHVSTDVAEIAGVLDRVVALDPVRGTQLGTMGLQLTATTWAAWHGDVVALRTEDGRPVVLSPGWDAPGLDALARLLRDVPGLRGVSGEVGAVDRVLDGLDAPVARRERQGLYRLDALTAPDVPGVPLRAGEVHRQLVRHWFAEFTLEAHQAPRPDTIADAAVDSGNCWLWVDVDGIPVSLAARRPVIAGSARVGPVYTPPALRGHGYAAAVTAAATRTVLDEAAVPVLFTDLDNPTSNGIYQRLGYRLVELRSAVRFAT